MKHWVCTQWPAVVDQEPWPVVRLQNEAEPELTSMRPPDMVLIFPFRPGRELLPARRPRREPLQTRWPGPEGAIVTARVVPPPTDPFDAPALTISRDGACWIRILDMRVPNYDGFSPAADIERILGVDPNRRFCRDHTQGRSLFPVSEEQFNRLLRLFATRQG